MGPKLLIFLTGTFYLLGKDSQDQVWLFCTLMGAFLTVCSFFYQIENRHKKPEKKDD